uniref:TORC_N domain-containing protein n=1 Tax=Meloidogyne hapla TaxID=6305 RepID=A0A1I8C0J1_MELHA
MGGSSSHMQPPAMLEHHQLPPSLIHDTTPFQTQQQQYQFPDMNQIFKGIPKMLQVADDMHRMSNYRLDDQSEQSSLSVSRPSNNYRHYHSAKPIDNWTHKIEMDRMLDSTSTRHTNLTPQHGAHGTVGSHGGSHGAIMMNNKSALASSSSPEHQHHYNSLPLHEQHQTSSVVATPSHTPTQIITGHSHQTNGQLKRLDPVKLIVDEMPYADNEHEQ